MRNITLYKKSKKYDIKHKDWWKYHCVQEKYCKEIEQKNTYILKPIFEKMVKQGVRKIIVPFSGGGDCGGFDGNIEYKDKKDKIIKLDYDKIQIDGIGIDKFEPLVWESKDNEIYIFQHESTEYADVKINEDWLIQRFYEFGFLNEWGSFAGEFHVSGTVEIDAITGEYKMPYQQSIEEYEDHEPEGSMFHEIKTSTEN
tara:strand:- start:1574 stop:2170 length:597 start_codon:yes stop_codon:yes gene_type:complete